MSFDKLKKEELVKIAEQYGADGSGNKADIIASLTAEGVTWEFYESLQSTKTPLETLESNSPKKAVAPEDEVIVKYLGQTSYGARGHRWTKASPFQVMSKDDAEFVIEKFDGVFTYASAKQVEDFYS